MGSLHGLRAILLGVGLSGYQGLGVGNQKHMKRAREEEKWAAVGCFSAMREQPLLLAWFEVQWAGLEGEKVVNRAREVKEVGTKRRSIARLRGQGETIPYEISKFAPSSMAAGHVSFKI